jgi:hypothetical protein
MMQRTIDFACNVFWNADDEILDSLAMLGEQDFDVDGAFTGLEAFIRLLYRSLFQSLLKARWHFYFKSTHTIYEVIFKLQFEKLLQSRFQ